MDDHPSESVLNVTLNDLLVGWLLTRLCFPVLIERMMNVNLSSIVDLFLSLSPLFLSQQPVSTSLHPFVSSPHPHHAIEPRPGYARHPLVDGNVLQVSVGITMPSASSTGKIDSEADLESLDYCIGTSDVVVCSLLNARQRLIGIN